MPKLLLADDSITIQRVIELTFSGEDVQVVAVGDGEEAITRIPSERPDIVLADIGMPKRNGYDVAAFVKADPSLAHIPVLLLAGAFEPVDQARADAVRCDGVLVKPFEPQQVISRVRELVNGARGARAAVVPESPVARPDAADVRGETHGNGREARAEAPEVRVIESPPIVEVPDPRALAAPAAPDADDSLDDYFDRLDAAFASLGTASAPVTPAVPLDEVPEPSSVPTIDDLLGIPSRPQPGDVPPPSGGIAGPPVEPPDTAATLAPAAPAASETRREDVAPSGAANARDDQAAADAGRNVIADVFSALLASEQGDGAPSGRLGAAAAPPAVTDDLVDELARRVLERLAPDAVKPLVAPIVSEVAERLVREEIARLRKA